MIKRSDRVRLGSQLLGILLLGCCLNRAAAQTGTFIDRDQASDLRVVSYNVLWDTIFPDENSTQAAKFNRVIDALDPDILNLQEIRRSASSVVQLMNSVSPLASGSWHAFRGNNNVIVSKYPLSMQATDTTPQGNREQAIALIDLPDAQYARDFYFLNNHYKCCGSTGSSEDQKRQQQSDAIINWIRDARLPGGSVNLAPGTPIAVVGDLNLVGGLGPLNTLVNGNISDEWTYGSDSPPDWDGSFFTDAHPRHNGSGSTDYTWRNDNSNFAPGRLDYVIYSDSALDVGNQFVLNTVAMSSSERAAAGLQTFDITVDSSGSRYDHLPVVVDFRLFDFASTDFNFDRQVNATDFATWQSGFGDQNALRSDGDADGDGDVDGTDFLRWQRDFSGPPAALSTTVPEPTSLALCLICSLFASYRRR